MKPLVTNRKDLFFFSWACLFVFTISFFIFGINHESIWFDESYTYAITNHSIPEIIQIITLDNHPPLYFIAIKVFTSVFGNSLVSLRLFSVIGALALMGLSLYPIKRILGEKGALFFGFLILVIPVFSSLAQDARMYTWGCFFVTGSVLFAYCLIIDRRIWDRIFFGIFVFCAALTHYYALLAVIILNLFLFLYFVFMDRKRLLPYIATALCLVLLFLPWFFTLMKQINQVTSSSWIPKTDVDIAYNAVTFLFNNKYATYENSFDFLSIIITSLLLIHALWISIKKKDSKRYLIYMCLIIYFGTFTFAFLFSLFVKPILFPRYMGNVSGLIIIVCSYGISVFKRPKTIVVIAIVFMLLSFPQQYYLRTNRLNGPMREAAAYVSKRIKPEDVFFHADFHTMGTFLYHFPDNMHYLILPDISDVNNDYKTYGSNMMYSEMNNKVFAGVNTIWLLNRQKIHRTLSRASFSDKSFIRAEDRKTFEFDSSWYVITIDYYIRESSNTVEPVQINISDCLF